MYKKCNETNINDLLLLVISFHQYKGKIFLLLDNQLTIIFGKYG